MAADGDDKVTFKYVFIPADPSLPMQERELTTTRADECSSLIDEAKRHFQAEHAASDASRAAHRAALLQRAGADASKLPAAALDAALGMQMVEPIALLHNTPQNGFVAVNMYADDQASFKGAPRNPRACDILLACGGNPMNVLGDVFIARIMDNEDDFKRLDFTLGELRSDAPWVREAAAQAARRRERSGEAQAFMERMRAAGGGGGGGGSAAATAAAARALPPPPPASPAEEAKARGNAAVARGDWAGAAEEYTAAIKLEPGLVAARNNRALALLRLGRNEDAEADCGAVLEAEPGNVKALLRRAAARAALGRPAEAAADLRRVLELQPGNKDAAVQLAALGEGLGGGGGGDGGGGGGGGNEESPPAPPSPT